MSAIVTLCNECDLPLGEHDGATHGHCADEKLRLQPPAGDPPAGSRLRLTPLSTVQPVRVRYVWDRRIAEGTLNALAGPEGLGKSTFLAWLAGAFTRGTLSGDCFGSPGAVLIAALEDDVAATLRPRMEAAGADLDLVANVDAPDGGGLRLPEHLELLREACGSFRPELRKLVILDPIKSTTAIKTRDESDVRPFLQKMLDFATETGATQLASMHFKKGARLEDFAAWKVSGDPAWTQVPRSVLFFDEDPEADEDDLDARLIAHAKTNLARKQETLTARVETVHIDGPEGRIETSRLSLGGPSSVRADDLGKRDREQQTAQGDAVEFLRGYLSDGLEHEASAIKAAAEADGHSERTMKRAARQLGVIQRREGAGAAHHSLWSLKELGPSGPSGPSQYSSAFDSGHSGQRVPSDNSPSPLTRATRATWAIDSLNGPEPGAQIGYANRCACADGGEDAGNGRCARCSGHLKR